MSVRIIVVGDFRPDIIAHRAINECFAVGMPRCGVRMTAEWMGTETIVPGDETAFRDVEGIWCAPGSPYRYPQGAFWAIEFARTRFVPFLGTCGGCQHALIEFARNVLNLKDADHAEETPDAALPLVSRLACPLVERSEKVKIVSEYFRDVYGAEYGLEGYHCNYGLNAQYEPAFAGSDLEIVARSEDGQARAFRLRNHPFFVGTQFQPERRIFEGSLHPLVQAFFSAANTTLRKQKGEP